MRLNEIKEILKERELDDTIILENPSYETAVIGIDESNRLIYDYDKMIEYLMETDKMEYDDAMEFIDYNTIRALPYMGCMKPIIKYNLE